MKNLTSDRRTFLKQCALAGLGSIFSPGLIRADHPATVAERIISLSQQYASNVRLSGGAAVASLLGHECPVLQLQVESLDFRGVAQAIKESGEGNQVFASGNTLFISTADGASCEIENVPPGAAPREVTLAHENVTADVDVTTAADPAGQYDGTIKLAQRPRGLLASFEAVLEGMIDGADLGLPEHRSFSRLRRTVLARRSLNRRAAEKIATVFFQNAATLAETLPPEDLVALIKSGLVSASLAKTLRVSGRRVATAVATAVDSGESAAVELVGQLVSGNSRLEPGELIGGILSNPNPLRRLRARTALAEATRLLGTSR